MTDADDQAETKSIQAPDGEQSNLAAFTVSELAFALRRTIEDAYGFVRVRGEISKVTFHASGHVYLDLKDERACISGVIWRGQVRGLAVRPETGLEVIVTGKITTYPGRSQYQIVIETMAPAGVGALLAQLERLKARLIAEGLFDAARKRPLPAYPGVIGVVTSPTGAVIRDILHRIRDRWPCRVIVWPVVVQGAQAAEQVRAAIEGFGALPAGEGPIRRPDLIIVARGGGSVEDLWPFNDEALARTAAASSIPLISAVGHETDTTLIDFASDRRAPTPTAAAELATPVWADLAAGLADVERRLRQCAAGLFAGRRDRLALAGSGLPRAVDLIAISSQRLDLAATRLSGGLERNLAAHVRRFTQVSAPLKPGLLARPAETKRQKLAGAASRLAPAVRRRIERSAAVLAALESLRVSFNPDGPLARGFARVLRQDGHLARSAGALRPGEAVELVFVDGARAATIAGAGRPAKRIADASSDGGQGRLF